MSDLSLLVLVISAAAIAILRIFTHQVDNHLLVDSYKALAHIFVGICIGAWLAFRKVDAVNVIYDLTRFSQLARFFAMLACGLTVWEIMCFIAGKSGLLYPVSQ